MWVWVKLPKTFYSNHHFCDLMKIEFWCNKVMDLCRWQGDVMEAEFKIYMSIYPWKSIKSQWLLAILRVVFSKSISCQWLFEKKNHLQWMILLQNHLHLVNFWKSLHGRDFFLQKSLAYSTVALVFVFKTRQQVNHDCQFIEDHYVWVAFECPLYMYIIL